MNERIRNEKKNALRKIRISKKGTLKGGYDTIRYDDKIVRWNLIWF